MDIDALNASVMGAFAERFEYVPRVPATHFRVPGVEEPSFPVRGILTRNQTRTILSEGGVPMVVRQTSLQVWLSEFPEEMPPLQGDRVVLGTETWIVQEPPRGDHGGMAILILGAVG